MQNYGDNVGSVLNLLVGQMACHQCQLYFVKVQMSIN